MNKNIILLIMFSILLVLPVFALENLGTFKQSNPIELIQICSDGTAICNSCTITSVKYPNSSRILSDQAMTKRTSDFNYSLSGDYTEVVGKYIVDGYCNTALNLEVWSYTFDVTNSGRPEPSGTMIIFFIVFYLILVGFTCYFAIYSIGHLMSLDFDIIDLAVDFGIYFVIIASYTFEVYYLNNPSIQNYMVWFLSIGGIFLILIPSIAFVLSITVGSLKKKSINISVPPKFRMRRRR